MTLCEEAEDTGFEATLRAYEHAKREQLANEGPAPLRRELAGLVRFLSTEGKEDPYLANVEVDVAFRQAKARVLQRLLAEAEEAQGEPGTGISGQDSDQEGEQKGLGGGDPR